MHLFTALPIPLFAAEALHVWSDRNRESLPFRKRTHPLDYHLTLQFLGAVPDERVPELLRALGGVRFSPFRIMLSGTGTFGQPVAPRVLYSTVDGDLDGLRSLHTSILQATAPLGYLPEDRPFAPHITIARRFDAGAGASWDARLLGTMPAGAAWIADRFALMRTHLNASPMYETVREFPAIPEARG
ncbi:RNA 2',3'-cyclic phosphodiesterase [Cohnella fermenti]|nr:RNA 2',3'-cyclic phosphodiesterase [Cohnella fermenti]